MKDDEIKERGNEVEREKKKVSGNRKGQNDYDADRGMEGEIQRE